MRVSRTITLRSHSRSLPRWSASERQWRDCASTLERPLQTPLEDVVLAVRDIVLGGLRGKRPRETTTHWGVVRQPKCALCSGHGRSGDAARPQDGCDAVYR